MLKALAVVRTLVLVFLVGYTVRAMPWFMSPARTFDESYARCADSLSLVLRAAWIAVGWVAIETIIGWVLATRHHIHPVAIAGATRVYSTAAIAKREVDGPAECDRQAGSDADRGRYLQAFLVTMPPGLAATVGALEEGVRH